MHALRYVSEINIYKKNPEKYVVIETRGNGKVILVKSTHTEQFLTRHPNDLKLYNGDIPDENVAVTPTEQKVLQAWRDVFEYIGNFNDNNIDEDPLCLPNVNDLHDEPDLRRSSRTRNPNPRYNDGDYIL